MGINFHPKPGMVLICDYETGFKPPEMVKKRRVIVVSPYQMNKHGLCTVVPVSATAPEPAEPYHYRIVSGAYPFFHSKKDVWVKCDMIARVAFERLDRLRIGPRFVAPSIALQEIVNIRKCIASALDI